MKVKAKENLEGLHQLIAEYNKAKSKDEKNKIRNEIAWLRVSDPEAVRKYVEFIDSL